MAYFNLTPNNNLTFENYSTMGDQFSNNSLSTTTSDIKNESRHTSADQKPYYVNDIEADRDHGAMRSDPRTQNEEREYLAYPEPISKPVHSYFVFEQRPRFFTPSHGNLPRLRQNSEGSEISSQSDSRRSSINEIDYWRPPISIPKGFAGNAQISYAEEAINAIEDNLSSIADARESSNWSTFRSKSLTFISDSFKTKFPERSWFCDRCRKPRDECRCICSIS